MNEVIYRCSTGEFVSETEIWERFEDGSWTPYCWDEENGTEWVKTANGASLKLVPVASETALDVGSDPRPTVPQ